MIKIRMQNQILLKGSDALDLLHRISTVQIQSLPLNQIQFSLILNPQGKIECAFYTTRLSQDTLQLQFSDDDQLTHQNKILQTLEQYTFGERYQITASAPTADSHSESKIEFQLQNMIPEYGFEFLADGKTNPLDINLRDAIHDQKGCYPGQEVIEKIISIGSPPKRLCWLRLQSNDSTSKIIAPTPLCPTPIYSDADCKNAVGTLTRIQAPDAMAIIKKTHSSVDQILYVPNEPNTLQLKIIRTST
jgi:folate-binding protein YgfZ